ncbi:ankyrin, partial [Piromyces finnis]
MTAIYYNNEYVLKYFISNFKSLTNINSAINLKKYLLFSNKINNHQAIKLIIEKIFDVSCLTPKSNQMELSMVKTFDVQHLSLIINSFVRLHELKMIVCLIESNELKGKINCSERDGNGDYPILVSLYENDIEIFEYFIGNGVDCRVCDVNNVPLFFIAHQHKNYKALQLLMNHNTFFIKPIISMKCSSQLEHAIFHHQLEKVKSLRCDHIHSFQTTSQPYFTSLSLAYLLNHTDIFNYLLQHDNINELDYHGYSLLYYAILKEDLSTIQKLIELGANIFYYCQRHPFLRQHSAIHLSINLKNYT